MSGYNKFMPDPEQKPIKPYRRLLFINVNKYQQQVLLPCALLCLLACAGVIYAMYYIHYVSDHMAVICQMDVVQLERDIPWFLKLQSVNRFIPWVFFSASLVLFGIVVWMFYISNKLLGPSARVLKELDGLLNGERKDPIGTRPGDELFEELLKRINPLIQKMK